MPAVGPLLVPVLGPQLVLAAGPPVDQKVGLFPPDHGNKLAHLISVHNRRYIVRLNTSLSYCYCHWARHICINCLDIFLFFARNVQCFTYAK